MKKTTRRLMAMVLSLAMMFGIMGNTVAFAAEVEERQENDEDVTVIELNLDDMVLLDSTESPYVSPSETTLSDSTVKVDLLNQAGITSSDLNLSFSVPILCMGTVYIILCFSYMDGTTGSISVKCAQYSGTVPVDGTARVAVSGGNLFGGNYSFKTVGLSKQMAYSVRIYVAS
jgi:hypothetical protein